MNITIRGYVSFVCSRCAKAHNIEAQTLTYKEDTSPEAEEDDYIRYISQVDTVCASCRNDMLISFDVWEYPEAISNYSYYSEVGANIIECEFTIEHFFDDAIAKLENTPQLADPEDESDLDHEESFNETQAVEGYVDQYDDNE